jgi:hypothetical protein
LAEPPGKTEIAIAVFRDGGPTISKVSALNVCIQ